MECSLDRACDRSHVCRMVCKAPAAASRTWGLASPRRSTYDICKVGQATGGSKGVNATGGGTSTACIGKVLPPFHPFGIVKSCRSVRSNRCLVDSKGRNATVGRYVVGKNVRLARTHQDIEEAAAVAG